MIDVVAELSKTVEQRVAAAVSAERERCAKIAEGFDDYTGLGHEDENSLVGMFARGNRSARRKSAHSRLVN